MYRIIVGVFDEKDKPVGMTYLESNPSIIGVIFAKILKYLKVQNDNINKEGAKSVLIEDFPSKN